MKVRVFLAGLLLAGASLALAEQYWIAYEGNDFPENEGWLRNFGNENGPLEGGAERSLDNGILTLDSLRHDQIFDFYEIQRPIDPDVGEVFVAEWRVLVDPQSDPHDVGIVIARDDPPGYVALDFSPEGVFIEPGNVWIDLEANSFHAFLFRSPDMQSFELTIDETVTFSGSFECASRLASLVNFGDAVQGERSLAEWDYFRFGVVPEPGTFVVFLCVALMAQRHAV